MHGLILAASRTHVAGRAWSLVIAVAALSMGFAALRDPKASALIILCVVIFFFGMCCPMLGGPWLIRAALGEAWASAGLGMLGVVLGVILPVPAVIEAAWMTRFDGVVLLVGAPRPGACARRTSAHAMPAHPCSRVNGDPERFIHQQPEASRNGRAARARAGRSDPTGESPPVPQIPTLERDGRLSHASGMIVRAGSPCRRSLGGG